MGNVMYCTVVVNFCNLSSLMKEKKKENLENISVGVFEVYIVHVSKC